jgi:hypothetical protein
VVVASLQTTYRLSLMLVARPRLLKKPLLLHRRPLLVGKFAQHRVPSAWLRNWVSTWQRSLVLAVVVVFPRKMLKLPPQVVVRVLMVPHR